MPVLANKSITRPGAYWNQRTQKWVTDLVPMGRCVRISPRRITPWLKKPFVYQVWFTMSHQWCSGGITIGVEGGNCVLFGKLSTTGGSMLWTNRNGTAKTGTSITIPRAASFHNNPSVGFRVVGATVRFEIYPVKEEFKITGAFASGAGDNTTGELRLDFTN